MGTESRLARLPPAGYIATSGSDLSRDGTDGPWLASDGSMSHTSRAAKASIASARRDRSSTRDSVTNSWLTCDRSGGAAATSRYRCDVPEVAERHGRQPAHHHLDDLGRESWGEIGPTVPDALERATTVLARSLPRWPGAVGCGTEHVRLRRGMIERPLRRLERRAHGYRTRGIMAEGFVVHRPRRSDLLCDFGEASDEATLSHDRRCSGLRNGRSHVYDTLAAGGDGCPSR